MSVEPYNSNNSPSTLGMTGAVLHKIGRKSYDKSGYEPDEYTVNDAVAEGKRKLTARAVGTLVAATLLAGAGFAEAESHHQLGEVPTPAPLTAGPHNPEQTQDNGQMIGTAAFVERK